MSSKSSATNSGLLSYGINTSPDPIQASPVDGNPSITSIVITVSNDSINNIYCNKLIFSLPIGDESQDLTAVSEGILSSVNSSSKWEISMDSPGVFIAIPTTPENNLITKEGLSFQVYNIQANKQVGTFKLTVDEDSSSDNKTFTTKKNTYSLTKFPYGFYVNNFAASAPMVNDGEPVTLTWVGSDLGSYTILYGTKSIDVSDHRSWTSPALTETTTFSLKATVQELGETVDTYLYVTVIVANQELIATSLKVLQTTTLQGATTVGSTLGVTGGTAVKDITASGTLTVSGNTGVADIAASGSLNVTGQSTMKDATVNGSLTVAGDTTLNNPTTVASSLSAMQSWITIDAQKKYTADTDGFVIGVVGYPGEAYTLCGTQIVGYLNGNCMMVATGGNVVYSDGKSNFSSWGSPNCLTMPVPKGGKFELKVVNGGSIDAPTYCYWVPLGTSGITSAISVKNTLDDFLKENIKPQAMKI